MIFRDKYCLEKIVGVERNTGVNNSQNTFFCTEIK